MKRSLLRTLSKSPVSATKRRIQALLRELAIRRDKTCVLGKFGLTGACSGPLQAEHLNGRSNSHTFGDMRNIVLLCQRHHILWKPHNSRLYWELIEQIVGTERWKWLKLAEANNYRPFKQDWTLVEIALKRELELST